MAISVEDARVLLRSEVAASSLAAVAERVGIDRSTLRTFTKPDGVTKPIARVLEPILAYAERRLGSARVGESPGGETEGGPDYSDGMLAAAHEMSQTLTLIIARAMAARAGTPQPARAEVDAARGRLRARAAADQDAATEARRG